MALPAPLHAGLLPSEIEYLATSSTHIFIVPLTSIEPARLLSGVYGPFRPPARTSVPVWLALHLKKKGKCYIIPPDWMLLENLQRLLQLETTTLPFAEVPFHYVSIAKVLLDAASDDIPDADEVRARLKDLREARQSKISEGLAMINPFHLEMTNIAYAELCELRPFFSTAFNHLRAMRPSTSQIPSQRYTAPTDEPIGQGFNRSMSFGGRNGSFSHGDGSMGYYDTTGSASRSRPIGDYTRSSMTPTPNDRQPVRGLGGESMGSSHTMEELMRSHRSGATGGHSMDDDTADDDDDGMGVAHWGGR